MVPSGDQAGSSTFDDGSLLMTRCWFEPSAFITQMVKVTPVRFDSNAIRVPSGDHVGLTLLPWSVSGIGSEPSIPMTQMLVLFTVNAIFVPSGETAGSVSFVPRVNVSCVRLLPSASMAHISLPGQTKTIFPFAPRSEEHTS